MYFNNRDYAPGFGVWGLGFGVEEAELGTAVTENYGNGYSSPLPPSSPPLSPMSGVEELEMECSFSRSSSPLSFLPSSPAMSEGRDLDLDDVEANEEEAVDEQDDEMVSLFLE